MTNAGLRSNVSIRFQYISFWLGGRGAVGLNSMMEVGLGRKSVADLSPADLVIAPGFRPGT